MPRWRSQNTSAEQDSEEKSCADSESEFSESSQCEKTDNDDVFYKYITRKPKFSNMTRRQRSLFEMKQTMANDKIDQVDQPKEKPKRVQRTNQRKEYEIQKRTKQQKKTVEKVLKKQVGRKRKIKPITSEKRSIISTVMRPGGTLISYPEGFEPKAKTSAGVCKETLSCGVEGCSNPKRYSCSVTGVPLCSLECYKINRLRD